jgi:hypothetical protein
MFQDYGGLALVKSLHTPMPCSRAEPRERKGVLKRHNFCEPLDGKVLVVPARQPSLLNDVSDDKTLTVEFAERRLTACTSCEQKEIFLLTLEETDDIVLIALLVVILGILLYVRFLFVPADYVPDWKQGLRAVEEELETALTFQIGHLKCSLKPFEFP